MKDISLQGYNSRFITMMCDGDANECDLVVMSANNTVKKANGGKFVGVVRSIRDGYALVQTGGYAVVKYSGGDPSVGFCSMAADADAGAVKSETGREVVVSDVDSVNKSIGMLF